MSARRFLVLLSNLSPDSTFKRIVNIRAESSYEVIKNYNEFEKKIHYEWKQKYNSNRKQPIKGNVLDRETLNKLFNS